MNTKEAIIEIKDKQKTIDELLSLGQISRHGEKSSSLWAVESLYHKGDCSIGFAHCNDMEATGFPEHVHRASKEYIVVVAGKVVLSIGGKNLREASEGECVAIPEGASHTCVPLVPCSKLAYICVPCDKGMDSV